MTPWARFARWLHTPQPRHCTECGTEMEPTSRWSGGDKFCSDDCYERNIERTAY